MAFLPAVSPGAADTVLRPVRVCEVLESPAKFDGETVALIGRYSFTEDGRFIGEESCGKELKTGEIAWPATLRLAESSVSAPRPEGPLQIDAAVLDRKLAAIRERTTLRRYAFGSPDYDRWAVVYGRFQASKEFVGTTAQVSKPETKFPGTLLYRGDGVILFLHNR